MRKDYGIYGEGLVGYLRYKDAFDAIFSQKPTNKTNLDTDDSRYEDFSKDDDFDDDDDDFDDIDDEDTEDDDGFEDDDDNDNDDDDDDDEDDDDDDDNDDDDNDDDDNDDEDENSTVEFTLSFGGKNVPAKLIPRDIAQIQPGEDLSKRYKIDDEDYDFRRALLEYFPEIRESYERSSEIDYEDILAQVLHVDFDLGCRAWRWMLEHFQRCLAEKLPSWSLCEAVLCRMNSSLHLPMAKKLGEDGEMLCWVFSKCFSFEQGQCDLLCACLYANDAVLFEKLLQYYIVRKDWLTDGSAHFDTVIEECLSYAEVSQENYEILQKYVRTAAVGLRKKYLEKCLQEYKPEE
ncbi:MAG: hypothetical protein RSG59_08995 [Ruthenibacterium sp.]